MEQLIEILRILKPDIMLCQVANGVAFNLSTLEDIPMEQLMYNTVPINGVYTMAKTTCSGSFVSYRDNNKPVPADRICNVGAPAKYCVANGVYSSRKCAVYSLTKYDEHVTLQTTIADLVKLVDEYTLIDDHY